MGGTSPSRICVPSCVPRAGWACVRLPPPPPPPSILCLCAGQGAFPPPIAPLLDSPCVRLRGGGSAPPSPPPLTAGERRGCPLPPQHLAPASRDPPAALSGAGPGARAAPGRRRLSLRAARSGAAAALRWRRRCAGGRGVAGTPAEVRPGRRGQGAHGGAGAQRGARHRPGGEPRGGWALGRGIWGAGGRGGWWCPAGTPRARYPGRDGCPRRPEALR